MSDGKIVAFGNFDLHGARSWVIRTGLEEHGYTVALCRTEVPGLIGKYRDLRRRWKACRENASAIYVVFLGHYLMPLAWYLGKHSGIPVIFDVFLSLHETEVHDRRRVSRFSPKAWLLWFTDWLACHLADVILIDTEEGKNYFIKKYGVHPKKILVLPVGCRFDLFWPQPEPKTKPQPEPKTFAVEFHGTYIPLQGAEIILTAAREIEKRGENVQFTLIGTPVERALMPIAEEWGLKNVRFHQSVSIDRLPQFLHEADVCLGIFGTNAKADRVIPNKAYEAIACGKPLITARTTAVRRVFRDQENILLCRAGDAGDLVEKIMVLKHDAALRKKIAEGGRELSEQQFQPGKIVESLVECLSKRIR